MRRITRRHTQLSKGYVTSVNDDGLVIAKPRRKFSRSTLRGVAIVVIVLMVFKAFLHNELGSNAYQQRVQALSAGSVFEQGGAVLMAGEAALRSGAGLVTLATRAEHRSEALERERKALETQCSEVRNFLM